MKQIMHYCLCALLVFILSFFQTIKVSVLANSEGCVTIELKEIDEDKDSHIYNIGFHLYRVGSIDSYGNPRIDDKYEVDKYPSKAEDSEVACSKILERLSDKELISGKTDMTGHLTFSSIKTGVYLIVADEINDYGQIQPSLIHLPYYTNVDGSQQGPFYDLKILPKSMGNGHIIIPDLDPDKDNEKPSNGDNDSTNNGDSSQNNGASNGNNSTQDNNGINGNDQPNNNGSNQNANKDNASDSSSDSKGDKNNNEIKTGDTSNKCMYVVFVFIAGVLMIILRKKGKEGNKL